MSIRRLAWALSIAGHPWVYATHAAFPLSPFTPLWPVDDPVIGPAPSVVPVLQPPGSMSADLPLLGGVADESSVELTLAIRGRGAGDPDAVFARLGTQGAHAWGLATGFDLGAGLVDAITADQDAPFVIRLDRDVLLDSSAQDTGHGFQVELDGESMLAEHNAAEPDRVTITHRAVGGTQRSTHIIADAVRDIPILTTWQVVTWRTRSATLWAAEIDALGQLGTPTQVLAGFIEATPRPSGTGTAISLALSPLTALLKADASFTPTETTVIAGLHKHQLGASDELDCFERITGAAGGPAWRGITRDVSAAGGGVLDLPAEDVAAWLALYDIDAPVWRPGPLGGAISIIGEILDVDDTAVDGGGGGDPDQLVVSVRGAPGPQAEKRAGLIAEPADGRILHWRPVDLLGWLRWPGDPDDPDGSVLGRINDALTTDTHIGLTGAWGSVRVLEDSVTLTRTVPATVDVAFPDQGGIRGVGPLNLDAIGAIDDSRVRAIDANNPRILRHSAGIAWSGDPANQDPARVLRCRSFEGPRTTPIRLAPAFIQAGETEIYLDAEIDVSGGQVAIQLNPGDLPRRFIRVPCAPLLTETVLPELDGPLDGETAWRLDLLDPFPHDVVDFEGDGIAIQTEVPAFDTSGEFLSWLLTDPARLNLPAASVDVQSLLAVGDDPAWVGAWRLPETEPGETQTYAELIDGVLRLTRSALVMNTRGGVSRITRVRVGAEDAGAVRGEITAGQLSSESVPQWDTDERLINQLDLAVDFGAQVDADGDVEWDYRLQETYTSRTSQRRFAEVATETIEAGAAGDVDRRDAGAIDATARAVIATYDAPRRTWKLSTSTALALSLP
ncbi:MAG: hypothetical protein KC583_14120, partial [Myxococcales bacterium]|nr:hypothetical protein [Myxococcales bacterium]